MDILTIAARAEGPMLMALLKVCEVVKHDRYGKVVCGKSLVKMLVHNLICAFFLDSFMHLGTEGLTRVPRNPDKFVMYW